MKVGMMKKSILILSDYKDEVSRIQRKDFASGNGRFFWHLLYKTGLNVRDLEIKYCREGIPKISEYRIIITLGQEAFNAYRVGSIRKNRGSVFVMGDTSFHIPTLHPRDLKKPFEVFREAPVETPQLVIFDLEKAVKIYERGFVRPEERFNLNPSIEELEDFVEETKNYPYLGVDIEGTGLNLDYTDIVVIGFACSRERALIVPLRSSGGAHYWSPDDILRAQRCLKELLLNRKLLFQNGYGYDVPLLRRDGWEIPWENFISDTMVLHHSLDPELPHNLGFISSVWGSQEYWKESFIDRKEHIYDTDQTEMRRYNARDCTALIEIYEAMNKELDKRGVRHIAEKAMKLVPSIILMKERGINKDLNKLTSWQRWINLELDRSNEKVRKDFELPSSFNFNSSDHKDWFFYGYKTEGILKKKEKLDDYDKKEESVQYECVVCRRKRSVRFETGKHPATLDTKCSTCRQNTPHERTKLAPKETKAKARDTKVYRDLSVVGALLETPCLVKPKAFRPNTTNSGKLGTGSEDVARFLNAVHKRQTALDELKRPTGVHLKEMEDLTVTSDFLTRFQTLTKLIKLKAAFFDVPTGKDQKIHSTILIQGAATGRFSCVNPNLQQIPNSRSEAGSKVRDIFMARPGYILVSVDFSNLEVNVGARFMEDKTTLKQLRAKLDIHGENTKTFFNVTENAPNWANLRAASKTIQFGRLFYGGSDRGIFSKVRTALPELNLSFEDFEQAVQNYFVDHPDFVKFMRHVQKIAREDRITVNGYGRVRRLYGPYQKLARQALNSPIQGTAADFMIDVMVRLWERGLGTQYKSYMCLQIHDELLFMVEQNELREVSKIISEEMLKKQEITTYLGNKSVFSVPISAEIGTNWGSMQGYDLETGETEGGTKH